MKSKIAVSMVALVTIALLVGCASVPKVQVPVVKEAPTVKETPIPEKTGEADRIAMYHSGKEVMNEEFNLGVGESIELESRVFDENGKVTKLMPTWEAEDLVDVGTWEKSEAALKIEPEVGNKVKVTVIGTGLKKTSKVNAVYVRADGKKIKESGPFIRIK